MCSVGLVQGMSMKSVETIDCKLFDREGKAQRQVQPSVKRKHTRKSDCLIVCGFYFLQVHFFLPQEDYKDSLDV